ncbi:MAG: gliding motility-associated protein GldE, partial [Flavobacteriales bacterium]|nr:gliding motility-associated protein GldE [Flavobacteriales bacterium]
EFDDDGTQYSKLDENTFVFEAKTSLNDFLKIVEGELDYFDEIKGDNETLAGLILEKTGVIPKISEKIDFPPYSFVVESADDRKINRLKVNIKR